MRSALVLGGTGMLAACAAELVERGWHVVSPSRRAPLMPDSLPGRAARATLKVGNRPTWLHADWARPAALAEDARAALDGPADLLVAWVDASYRQSVLRAVAPLLAPHAPVVEVHAASPVPDPVLDGHPAQQVLLGHFAHDANRRISAGVLAAVDRALAGRPPSLHRVDEYSFR